MRHSLIRRFRRSSTPEHISILPQKNHFGFTTHANPVNPEVDIIFVHGVDGGSFTSWTRNEDPRLYWPREWLPKELELSRARIHTYGYNLAPKRDYSSECEFASQFLTELICSPLWFGTLPIILVGHSTGGMIIKRAYTIAKSSHLYKRPCQAIQSIIFISTPHVPLDLASFKKWKKINPCLTTKPAMDYAIERLSSQFQTVDRNIRIFSFVEAKPTSIGRGRRRVMICSRRNCVVGLPREIVVPVVASHKSMTKFKSPNDANYATFYRHLLAALREIREVNRTPLTPPPAYTPYWVSPAEYQWTRRPYKIQRRATW
ncbi:hypothetical protein BDZ91DRAFT_712117 [Kalaharituber pfeilii]|nr:hypothetical protein BDZ91DRAFT_712117 [Kalaharituber pfeilii]